VKGGGAGGHTESLLCEAAVRSVFQGCTVRVASSSKQVNCAIYRKMV
jgi:hypothetical protein